MSVPITSPSMDSATLVPVPASGPDEQAFALAPLHLADLIVRQNRTSAVMTQTEQVDIFSPATNTTSQNGSSFAVEIEHSRYRPRLMFAPEARTSFRALQKWEGVVLEVASDTFRAHLIPLRGEGREQVAEIYLTELDDDDRGLVQPGAVFYWSIGYLDQPAGRLRASILRFRRLPGWTSEELARAETEVERLRVLFADG